MREAAVFYANTKKNYVVEKMELKHTDMSSHLSGDCFISVIDFSNFDYDNMHIYLQTLIQSNLEKYRGIKVLIEKSIKEKYNL